MYSLLGKVKAAVSFDQNMFGGAVEQGTHLTTMSFIESSRSSSIKNGMGTGSKMNMMISPLKRLVETDDPSADSNGDSVEDLIDLTR
mmetsp:Transcript_37819/g.49710  ORF Transcript_37819/g.49710 Transcript_37819/m.49710 type:complete len:87 (-) Transcript_37819:1351-1611(-)